MKEKGIPVGIYNKEVYIALYEDGVFHGFGVIRPVTEEMLSDLRDADTYKNYCEDLWKCAVQAGNTELGLLDFAQELIDEADIDNDDEAFPCKDESDCQYLTGEYREIADAYLKGQGINVGTWESAGSYAPNSFNEDFKKFDYVLNKTEAQKFYKTLK